MRACWWPKTSESSRSFLTGESLPVDKQVDPVAVNDPDRASMLFEGSTIASPDTPARSW